ncbi:DNA polymerase III subunit gamma and tau [Arthrobacter echini]|uniref:DNA polymerase III subunit gamma/tau n=1 Tax=Arthrobacter echini TaxID=1529066 RepID=A0A4S5E313_9MICC|nr:DNA polymerase III subunit gamma and tau [Arthrobacter echini]THJ65798.1 DNA polymerase III subunit gamma and tau [Arthrobacter echini]
MSTALYRRYRPETFADVIGQEHVTDPLMAAIDKDRINHAYLFSGPRGCGKTTSARILARCLNCAQGPTSTPCGVCDSCVGLARDGSGTLDVIEIDAASHGGVDDARDLRERATFAPVRDRFKIFIIDEAHMVTSAGFNALLKIVEEPPEHILFIFATTEPDKVIGTIRSRTHHYPFRLVPPEPLMAYLDLLCRQENVPVAPGVLSLVVRAGGGSVRDSLSVLDQLMAGAGENGLDYELAVSLLGYTHAALLDDVVDSMAAGDAGTVFNAVDRVIQTGHDPRRFVEDLLERFRDLIVINAVPEGAASILRGVPDDQLNRMRTQANQLGAGELSRAADVTNTALTEMTGATSPRLHLELLCARLLLPASDASVRGTLARVDRIERRLEYAGGAPAVDSVADGVVDPGAEPASAPEGTVRPAERSRLDGVPRNAEEAAAQWSLPTSTPDPHAPAVPSAARTGSPTPADASADWGASWGVSTDAGFSGQASSGADRPAAPADGDTAAGAAGRSDADRPAGASTAGDPSGSDRATEVGNAHTPSEVTDASSDPVAPPSDGSSGSDHPGPTSGPSGADRTDVPESAHAVPRGSDRSSGDAEAPAAREHRAAQQDTPVSDHVPAPSESDRSAPRSGNPVARSSAPGERRPSPQGAAPPQTTPSPESQQQAAPAPGTPPRQGHASSENIEMIRRAWPEIMDEVAGIKRATWLIVNVSAAPRSFDGNRLVLAFANQGNAIGFQRGPHMDNVRQAIHKVLGLTCSIEVVHDPGGAGGADPKAPAGPPASTSNQRPAATPSARRPSTASVPDAGQQRQPVRQDDAGAAEGAQRQQPLRPDVSSTDESAQRRQPSPPGPAPTTGPSHRRQPSPPEPVGRANQSADPRPRSSEGSGSSEGSSSEELRTPSSQSSDDGPRGVGDAGARKATGSVEQPVSAWDPTTADDSWALVEPPEEAFDPGAEWGSVPDDPFEGRPGAPGGERRTGREAPALAPGDQPVSAGHDSRSVVWSPPVSPAPERHVSNGAAQQERPGSVGHKPVSRYQQLLDQAQRNVAEDTAATGSAVGPRFVEDEPSADDETLEESGLVGRAAIERILNGRLIEERAHDNQ